MPPIGPPGFVTEAVGAGFAPTAVVTLAWAPGAGTTRVTTDATGAFRTPMLVYPNDTIGPRTLIATSAAGVATTAFIVATPTANVPLFAR
jgi:hypothetical protein